MGQAAAVVVVVGGSFAGLTAALELKRQLGRRVEVTVVEPEESFLFRPSLHWLAVGLRREQQLSIPLGKILAPAGIRWLRARATEIRAEANRVELEDGSVLSYDHMVIATGPHLDFGAVPGLGENANHVMDLDGATATGVAWRAYLDGGGGPLVVGAVQGVSCFGPAHEFCFLADHILRRTGIRHRSPIRFVTSEPFVGHMGLGGVGNSRRMFVDEMDKRDIVWEANATVAEVAPGKVTLGNGEELVSRFTLFVPPFRGVDLVLRSGLGNPKGWMAVDGTYRHPKHSNVFAAGVAVALPPRETTPVPTAPPKTGYMAEGMARVVARNIAATVLGRPLTELPPAELDIVCISDLGREAAFMYSTQVLAPRNHVYVKKGRWAHRMKETFERYYLFKLRHRATAWDGLERMLLAKTFGRLES